MDENSQPQEISTPQVPEIPSSSVPTGKKGPTIFIAVVILLLIGGVVFYFGFKSRKSSEEPSPTPTESTTSTPTPNEEADKSPTPTKKPTSTPTPKPTATPTPSPQPATQTMTLSAASSLDGFQSSNGGGNAGIEIRAGRNVNLITRGFVSFDISSIPVGKTIDEATLRLYQTSVTGNPYGVGSSLKVDHLDYGSSSENTDFIGSFFFLSFLHFTTKLNI